MAQFGTRLLENWGAAVAGPPIAWPGGQGVFQAVASTFGGGTIKLQFLADDATGTTWVDAGANTTLTVNGAGLFTLGPCQIRATVITAAPTAAFARVDRVPVSQV